MKKLALALMLSWVASSWVVGCGGDDDDELTGMEACQQGNAVLCDKFFECFTQEELDAAKDTVGLNSADCKVKFNNASCTPSNVACDSGETYSPSNAKACVDAFKSFSCDDIRGFGESTPNPAICDQVCTRK